MEKSLQVNEGETIVLFGPVGSGKTDLLESIFSERESDRLRELFDYETLLNREKLKDQIGYFPKHFEGFRQLTVRENLSILARMFSNRVETRELISKFNLQSVETTKVKHLSKGEKRRVGIVAALVNDPKFIILDEPSLDLSTKGREEIWKIIRMLANERKILVITTRYPHEAEALANFLVIIHKGEIVRAGLRTDVMHGFLGHRTVILEEISSPLPQDFLNQFPMARISGDRLELEASNRKEVGELIAFLGRQAIDGKLLVKKRSLSDLFNQLTGTEISPEGEIL